VVETSHQPKRSKDNPPDQESDVHLGSFLSLDSGPHSRLYDSVMATNLHPASATMQIGEVAKRTCLTGLCPQIGEHGESRILVD
jgi:hypothetical protein